MWYIHVITNVSATMCLNWYTYVLFWGGFKTFVLSLRQGKQYIYNPIRRGMFRKVSIVTYTISFEPLSQGNTDLMTSAWRAWYIISSRQLINGCTSYISRNCLMRLMFPYAERNVITFLNVQSICTKIWRQVSSSARFTSYFNFVTSKISQIVVSIFCF